MTRAQHIRALRAIAAFIAMIIVMAVARIVADKTIGESRRASHAKRIATFDVAGKRVMLDAAVIAAVGNLKPTSAPKIESYFGYRDSVYGNWEAEVESELTSGTLFIALHTEEDDTWYINECSLTTLAPPAHIAAEFLSTPYRETPPLPPGSSAKYTSVRLQPAMIPIEP